jgi:hypothetical protein
MVVYVLSNAGYSHRVDVEQNDDGSWSGSVNNPPARDITKFQGATKAEVLLACVEFVLKFR